MIVHDNKFSMGGIPLDFIYRSPLPHIGSFFGEERLFFLNLSCKLCWAILFFHPVTASYPSFRLGEEIISGAQRVHVADFLAEQAASKGIDVRTISTYIDSFR